jgi:hypothetical protein
MVSVTLRSSELISSIFRFCLFTLSPPAAFTCSAHKR